MACANAANGARSRLGVERTWAVVSSALRRMKTGVRSAGPPQASTPKIGGADRRKAERGCLRLSVEIDVAQLGDKKIFSFEAVYHPMFVRCSA